jgi:hypothetical protein
MFNLLLKRHMPLLVAIGVLVILVALTYGTYTAFLADQSKLSKLDREVKDLKAKTTILKSNTSLTKERITEYNIMLSRLIPDKEDYFSIVYALEQLSAATGFTVVSYAINLDASTSEKLAITIQGDGDPETFLSFLKNYPFAGGRLITNEKIEFSSSEIGKIRLSLNFYSKKLPKNASGDVTNISNNDLKLMEHVRSKTALVFKTSQGETTVVEEYPTKTNPF